MGKPTHIGLNKPNTRRHTHVPIPQPKRRLPKKTHKNPTHRNHTNHHSHSAHPMTTIIGIEHQNGCTIASDGQITTYDNTGLSLQKQHLPTQHINKICNHPGYIFATAGDLRALNLIQHALQPTPPPKNPTKTLHHIINTLIPQIQQTYETHQYRHNNTNQTPETSSTILIATNGQIFTLDDDYAIGKDTLGIYALGTGAHYAIGALHALQPAQYTNSQQELEKLVHHVYNIVNHHDPNTGPPYTIQHQPPPKNPKKTGNQPK